jgi:hypothetical protein
MQGVPTSKQRKHSIAHYSTKEVGMMTPETASYLQNCNYAPETEGPHQPAQNYFISIIGKNSAKVAEKRGSV